MAHHNILSAPSAVWSLQRMLGRTLSELRKLLDVASEKKFYPRIKENVK